MNKKQFNAIVMELKKSNELLQKLVAPEIIKIGSSSDESLKELIRAVENGEFNHLLDPEKNEHGLEDASRTQQR